MNFIFGYCGQNAAKIKNVWTNEIRQYLNNPMMEILCDDQCFLSEIEFEKHSNRRSIHDLTYTSGFIGRLDYSTNLISAVTDEEKRGLFDRARTNPHIYSNYVGNYLIVDFSGEYLKIFNDYYGTHPLYYFQSNYGIYFSNNILYLLMCSDVPFSANVAACQLYCSSAFSVDEVCLYDETFFEMINRLPPSSELKIVKSKGTSTVFTVNYNKYFDDLKYYEDNGEGSISEYLSILRKRLDALTAFALHENDRSVVGVSLSGGVDSASVLGSLISNGFSDSIISYNLSFKAQELYHCSDRLIVQDVLKRTGTKGCIIYGDETLRISNSEFGRDPITFPNGPTCLGNELFYSIITSLLNKDGGSLLFGGDGGDFLFEGTKYCGDYFIKHRGIKEAKKRSDYLAFAEDKSKLSSFFHYNVIPLLPFVSDRIYEHLFWGDIELKEKYEYLSDTIRKIDDKMSKQNNGYKKSKFLSDWSRRYIYDFMIPKGEYVDVQFGHSYDYHPLMDISMMMFAMSVPPWTHYDINLLPVGNYESRKRLLRMAYSDILPPSIVKQKEKTVYGSMMSLSIRNDKVHIWNLFANSKRTICEEIGCIKKREFSDKLLSVLHFVDDPHFLINEELHRIVNIIRLEIWLRQLELGRENFIKQCLRTDMNLNFEIEQL